MPFSEMILHQRLVHFLNLNFKTLLKFPILNLNPQFLSIQILLMKT